MGSAAVSARRDLAQHVQPGDHRGFAAGEQAVDRIFPAHRFRQNSVRRRRADAAAADPFEQSTDRDMRKRASEARYGFMSEHEPNFDRIYDELVKVRDRIARSSDTTITSSSAMRG